MTLNHDLYVILSGQFICFDPQRYNNMVIVSKYDSVCIEVSGAITAER